jgi:PhoH-like ATPase
MDSNEDVKLISEDIALRVKCSSLGVKTFNLSDEEIKTEKIDEIKTLEVDVEEIENLFKHGIMSMPEHGFSNNQNLVIKSGTSSALGIVDSPNSIRTLKFILKDTDIQGIKPRSKEQYFALEHLMDPDISLVTLTGMAGCGKTLLAIAAALEHIQIGNYKKLIIARPAQSTSKDIGFLPGSLEEKLAPWLQPIMDNLEIILSKHGMDYIDMMKKKNILEMVALTHIRGRTLPDTIFIIDEAQNITRHEAKALLTRMGENSKIILIGDLEQIDSPAVTEMTSGLASVVQLFKDFDESAHVHLAKGERSKLADYAAKVM